MDEALGTLREGGEKSSPQRRQTGISGRMGEYCTITVEEGECGVQVSLRQRLHVNLPCEAGEPQLCLLLVLNPLALHLEPRPQREVVGRELLVGDRGVGDRQRLGADEAELRGVEQ